MRRQGASNLRFHATSPNSDPCGELHLSFRSGMPQRALANVTVPIEVISIYLQDNSLSAVRHFGGTSALCVNTRWHFSFMEYLTSALWGTRWRKSLNNRAINFSLMRKPTSCVRVAP